MKEKTGSQRKSCFRQTRVCRGRGTDRVLPFVWGTGTKKQLFIHSKIVIEFLLCAQKGKKKKNEQKKTEWLRGQEERSGENSYEIISFSVAKCEGGSEARTWGCTKQSEVIIVLCFGAQEQKQRRKKTEAIQSWAMSRWKQEKGKGQEDKEILRPEWPYIFLKKTSIWKLLRMGRDKEPDPGVKSWVGVGVEYWENTFMQVDGVESKGMP